VRLGAGDGGSVVEVPAGSRAVFDGSGEVPLVVSPEGVGRFRNLAGEWTTGGDGGGGVVVRRVEGPVSLELAGGGRAIVKSGDVFRAGGVDEPLAYRGTEGTFARTGDGWVRVNARPAEVRRG
jgi:hypothetical protein